MLTDDAEEKLHWSSTLEMKNSVFSEMHSEESKCPVLQLASELIPGKKN